MNSKRPQMPIHATHREPLRHIKIHPTAAARFEVTIGLLLVLLSVPQAKICPFSLSGTVVAVDYYVICRLWRATVVRRPTCESRLAHTCYPCKTATSSIAQALSPVTRQFSSSDDTGGLVRNPQPHRVLRYRSARIWRHGKRSSRDCVLRAGAWQRYSGSVRETRPSTWRNGHS